MLRLFYALALSGILLSCNQPEKQQQTTDDKSTTADTSTTTTAAPEFTYDAAMEPTTVGAKFTKMLNDTLGIKLYEFTIKPGDSAAIHKHPDHVVYVLQGGKLNISFNNGPMQEMNLQTGTGFVSGSLSDYGKNIGKTTIKLVVADIYRPRGKQ